MHGRNNRILSALLLVALLFSAFPTLTSCKKTQSLPSISIDVLKIGKADCIVINTGDGLVMIDTGELENLASIHNYMQTNQYTKIDTLILTHYDKDHIGCADAIISGYGVATVIEPHVTDVTAKYVTYHNTISALGVSLEKPRSPYTFTLSDCTFTVDVPQKSQYKNKHDNNISLIVSMHYGDKSFLFCGDAMETRLKEWINGAYGQFDFVKLPYHGNALDNYDDFLDACKPSYAAITCSKRNPPDQGLLALLDEYGTSVYLTTDGTVRVTCDGSSISISQ